VKTFSKAQPFIFLTGLESSLLKLIYTAMAGTDHSTAIIYQQVIIGFRLNWLILKEISGLKKGILV
jgi:hypothetical protein